MKKEISILEKDILFGTITDLKWDEFLISNYSSSRKIILVDKTTEKLCLPYLLNASSKELSGAEIIVLQGGEKNKTVSNCEKVWTELIEKEIKRNDLIINLGGGIISDMGGMIAGMYKRGMDFIHIPTTLLAMVDASIGGKTGVNFQSYKNLIGLYRLPQLIICDSHFLFTLPEKELQSGKAEMIKHGAIANEKLYNLLLTSQLSIPTIQQIKEAVEVKLSIVNKDVEESGERKKLNFGHTIGHAIESHLHSSQKEEFTHGECVAWGMAVEMFLSIRYKGFPKEEWEKYCNYVKINYPKLPIDGLSYKEIVQWMKNDKKNKSDKINFTLLNKIGSATIDMEIDEADICIAMKKVFS